MTGAGPRIAWGAWAVHLLTASGAVWAFLALLAVLQSDARSCLLWLGLALLVDGIDGPLARWMRVKERVPLFDGAALDLIVDYLTYVFVPVVFIWKFALLPTALLLPGCAFVLLTSLHLFAKLDMKSADNHFVGFPGIWNVVVLYIVILDTGPWINAALVLALGLLTFAPAKFLHPFRVVRLRRVTLLMSLVWLVTTLALVFTLPERPLWALLPWGLASVWFTGLSLWRTVERA